MRRFTTERLSCVYLYSQCMCIIAFIVHTSVGIVVVNMQCIHVVPALPANEVSTANEDRVSHVHLYVSAASAILTFNGLLWHVVNSRLSNSENPSRVSHKMTELALLHWKDWIFTSFEDESPNMRVYCNSLQQVTVPMHWENCYNSIDSALVTLQPSTVTFIKIYTPLFSGRFVIGQIDTGKALNQLTYFTALCSIAWWTTCIQEGALLLFSPSNTQHTLSYKK